MYWNCCSLSFHSSSRLSSVHTSSLHLRSRYTSVPLTCHLCFVLVLTSVDTRYLPYLSTVHDTCHNGCDTYVTLCLPGYLLTYHSLLPTLLGGLLLYVIDVLHLWLRGWCPNAIICRFIHGPHLDSPRGESVPLWGRTSPWRATGFNRGLTRLNLTLSPLTRGLLTYVIYTFIMFGYYGAILFGITMGFTSLIPLTAVNNQIAMRDCFNQSDTHTLVTVRAFAGTANHCVDNRYLWYPLPPIGGFIYLCNLYGLSIDICTISTIHCCCTTCSQC